MISYQLLSAPILQINLKLIITMAAKNSSTSPVTMASRSTAFALHTTNTVYHETAIHLAETTGLLNDAQIMALSASDTITLIYYFQETFLARGGRNATPSEREVMLKLYAKMEVFSWLLKNPGGVETAEQAQLLEESIVHATGVVEIELEHSEIMRGVVREVIWQVAIDMVRCRNMSKGKKRKIDREGREEKQRVCVGRGGDISGCNRTGMEGYKMG